MESESLRKEFGEKAISSMNNFSIDKIGSKFYNLMFEQKTMNENSY